MAYAIRLAPATPEAKIILAQALSVWARTPMAALIRGLSTAPAAGKRTGLSLRHCWKNTVRCRSRPGGGTSRPGSDGVTTR